MNDVKEALQAIVRNGVLKPSSVVEAAEKVDSPLHKYFEWDDTKAAGKHREQQAREIIRSVKIIIEAPNPIEVRAYVSLAADRKEGNGYRAIIEVMDNEFLRRQLSNEILDTVKKWEDKALIIGAIVNFQETRNTAKAMAK